MRRSALPPQARRAAPRTRPALSRPRSSLQVWSLSDLPELILNVDSEADLALAHLHLVIMDYDHLTEDDRMGTVTLPLAPYAKRGSAAIEFSAPVVKDSARFGTLSGKIAVRRD